MLLTEPTAKRWLAGLGVRVPRGIVAGDAQTAAKLAASLHFPLVAKVVSADISHKTAVGGVRLGLESPADVEEAAETILASASRARPDARIEGVLVEEQLVGGLECIVGFTRQSSAGAVVAFGAGGIFVEQRRDVAFRLAPLDHSAALGMIRETDVARGLALAGPDTTTALVDVLVRFGHIVMDDPTIAEAEINPLLILPDGLVALDAMVHRTEEPDHARPANNAAEEVSKANLGAMLEPSSIAVIGASSDPTKPGSLLLQNIIDGGYQGAIYPINPHSSRILGYRAYPSVAKLPRTVDVAFITVPRSGAIAALEACAQQGIRSAAVIAAGYAEVGSTGAEDQARMTKLAHTTGLRVIGPNTIGMVCMPSRLIGTFLPFAHWEDGDVAIFAQTGIFAGAPHAGLMAQRYQRLGVRFSVDVGNKCDVDEVDFLAYVAARADVGVIGLYVESIRDPQRFLRLASEIKTQRPIIVLKPGRTAAGAAASASHTGSLAADDAVLDAAFKECGLVRATDHEDFVTLLRAFSWRSETAGPSLGIVTYSGGLGAIAADEAVGLGLRLSEWGPHTRSRLEALVPEWQPVGNPADLGIALGFTDSRMALEEPLDAMLCDGEVDAVLAIILAMPGADFDGMREAFSSLRERHPSKPLLLVIYGGSLKDRWMESVEGLRIPVFPSSKMAVRALSVMSWYESVKDKLHPAVGASTLRSRSIG